MKLFILLGVTLYVCMISVRADDPADTLTDDSSTGTDDEGTTDTTTTTTTEAPVNDDNSGGDTLATDQATADDASATTADDATNTDDQVDLSDPSVADQELPAELFKASKSSRKRPFGDRYPYPPIVQGGRPTPQHPEPFKALRILKDHKKANGRYPKRTRIPAPKHFSCKKVHQAGFYADEDFDCQVFRRCDLHGGMTSYICPIQTLFNQITLVCEWYYNVKCSRSSDFFDYSNSRLYHVNWPLLGNERGHHDGQGHGNGHNNNGYGGHHDNGNDNDDDRHDGPGGENGHNNNGYGNDHHDGNGHGNGHDDGGHGNGYDDNHHGSGHGNENGHGHGDNDHGNGYDDNHHDGGHYQDGGDNHENGHHSNGPAKPPRKPYGGNGYKAKI